MSDDVRADARRLLQGITPAPWSVDYETSDCYPYERYAYAISGPRNTGLDVPHVSDEYRAQYGNQMSEIVGISDADAEFIAAAPELVDRLLAELDKITAGRDLSARTLDRTLRDVQSAAGVDSEIDDFDYILDVIDTSRRHLTAANATLARIQAVAADVDQDGGHSGPSLARHILNIIGGEA